MHIYAIYVGSVKKNPRNKPKYNCQAFSMHVRYKEQWYGTN